MKNSTLLTLLLWAMIFILGMAVGYGISASWHSVPPFKPKPVHYQPVQYVEVSHE